MIKKSIYVVTIFSFFTQCSSIDTTRKLPLYLGLCAEFWDLDKPIPSKAEYTFFRKYVSQSRGPILEPMCGTGRYLIRFLEEGFNVEGFDSSSFMLKELRAKCTKKNLSFCVWEQCLEVVPNEEKYNLIFIPDTSFCIFLDDAHIKKCLQNLYARLLPGGTFVFDVQTTYSKAEQPGVWCGQAYKRSDDTVLIESTLPLPVQNSILTLVMRYDLIKGSEILKTEMEYYPIKLYKKGEMDNFLKEVGFKHIKKIKAHAYGRRPSPHDDIIVYECKK